jgi:glyceraldehyde 3-phosphate dehydrogenase
MTDRKTRVGLFGFGRIGRNIFRQVVDHPTIEIAAIVDIADPAALVYLLKYDTVLGRFPKQVTLEDDALVVDGRPIPMRQDPDPGDTDWAALEVDVVVQATRKHRTAAECRKHLEAGAKRVVLASTPEDPDDMDTLIMGVNDHVLDPSDVMIALGSNTSNAVGPILRLYDEHFGVQKALFTTVHAFTNEHRLGDVPGETLRGSRSAAENIIPAPTNSPEIIEQALPSMAGRLTGMALNVPVPDGSSVDLVTILSRPVTVDEVRGAVQTSAAGSSVIEYCDEPIVSSDVIGNPHSAIFDGLATMVLDGTMLKSVIWFDNGWGYAARAVEVISKLAAFDSEGVNA